MSEKFKKSGRPTDSPKINLIKFRCDQKSKENLDFCARSLSITKSEVIRLSIRKLYNEIYEKKNM